MPSLTLTQIANAAALYLGILDSGEAISTAQVSDALAAANNLLDNWSSDDLYILYITRSVQSLTSGQQAYSIGSGQAWNQIRPAAIVSAAFANSQGPGGAMRVCTAEEWGAIPDRQSTSYVIKNLFYDRGNPSGNCYVSPVPQGFGLTVELLYWAPLAQFPDATTPLTLQPGYARLLELALAVELAPQYRMTPSPALLANLAEAKSIIRGLNAQLTAQPQAQA